MEKTKSHSPTKTPWNQPAIAILNGGGCSSGMLAAHTAIHHIAMYARFSVHVSDTQNFHPQVVRRDCLLRFLIFPCTPAQTCVLHGVGYKRLALPRTAQAQQIQE